jgi:chemotaxis protein methyltransferase CheR
VSTVTPIQRGSGLDSELKRAYLRLIEERFGLRLTDHQARHLDDIVVELLAKTEYSGPLELYGALTAGWRCDLLEILAARLTIGETHFFRVGPQIEALRRVVLPDLLGRRAGERRLRVWSAGCSTGEEPYTLAILIRERLPAPETWDIQLLATDISLPALEAARRALYGEWSFRGTPNEVRERYFSPEGKRWRLVEPVRRMVRFARLNLAADPFPSLGPQNDAAPRGPAFDLIVCRNVTIYFSPEVTQRLYRRFADALATGAWLVLGPSDPTPEQPGPLEPVYLPGAVLWRRPTAAPALPVQRTWATAARAGATPTYPGVRRPPMLPPAPPREAPPDLEQVRTLAHGGDRAAAREQAERLVRARPLEAEAHLLLGMLDLDEGSAGPALASLRRATFLDARDALAHFSLGRAYLQLGDQARARAALIHARGILLAAPDDQAIPGRGELSAGELRHAIETQLASLGWVNRGG